MRIRLWMLFAATAVSLLFSSPAFSQGRADVLKELVPPPKLLLRHSDELGLTAKQKSELKQIVKDAQAASLDLEFKVQEEAEQLAKLIGADSVDVGKSLAQADKLMAAETALKRVKLEMMLKTKVLLTPAQLKKIDTIREQRRSERQDRRTRRQGAP